ncbi:class I SAM-dependent methyltransferase [Niveibacterium sp.]|uniref:class I SAM-dependent methyltransferase n=1 Tax=Niveibacterium sp. TaxID=2017444 RepID=UPI0035B0457D
MQHSFWDERYARPGYFYGTEPNDFLRAQAADMPIGEVLCIGEGEGRNALHLARLGHRVTAVDQSEVGMAKLRERAAAEQLAVNAVVADLAEFHFGAARWSAIVSIFCHLPSGLRASVHQRAAHALAPGGRLILEAYTPRQLAFGTGGPSDPDMLCEAAALRTELATLSFDHLVELEREVIEGPAQSGLAAVVQLVARRPG